jgi:hypothetical protein
VKPIFKQLAVLTTFMIVTGTAFVGWMIWDTLVPHVQYARSGETVMIGEDSGSKFLVESTASVCIDLAVSNNGYFSVLTPSGKIEPDHNVGSYFIKEQESCFSSGMWTFEEGGALLNLQSKSALKVTTYESNFRKIGVTAIFGLIIAALWWSYIKALQSTFVLPKKEKTKA